jgi:adenylate kinase family enzyme
MSNLSLHIMQGLPGSGKTTKSYELASTTDAVVLSTDDFFVDSETGKYNYNGKLLKDAHQWNQQRALDALKSGQSVIIDNTNLQNWQVFPYAKMAVEYDAEIKFIRCNGEYKNIHGVSDDTIENMKHKMEVLTIKDVFSSSSKLLEKYQRQQALRQMFANKAKQAAEAKLPTKPVDLTSHWGIRKPVIPPKSEEEMKLEAAAAAEREAFAKAPKYMSQNGLVLVDPKTRKPVNGKK